MPPPSDPGTVTPSRSRSIIGTVIAGKYELVERLRTSRLGTVYKALPVNGEVAVALRLLSANLVAEPRIVARFERATEVWTQLRHEHIVRVLDHGRDEARCWATEELVAGRSLGLHLGTTGPMSSGDALEVTRQLALALTYAHSLGVVHGGVTSQSVLIQNGSRLRVMLADFGIETTRGQASSEGLADVFGLGLVLLEMCAGRPALSDFSPAEIVGRLVCGDGIPPPALAGGTPRELIDIVSRATCVDPEARYQSMNAMLSAIERCHGTNTSDRASITIGSPSPSKASPTVRCWNGRFRQLQSWRYYAVAAAAVMATGLAWYAWQASTPREPLRVLPVVPATLAWTSVEPIAPDQEVVEGGRLRFTVRTSAVRNHGVRYTWLLDGKACGEGPTWEYAPGFEAGGQTRTVTVVATSGDPSLEHTWHVRVRNTNRAPVIEAAVPASTEVRLTAGVSQEFSVAAADPDQIDGDILTYRWEHDGQLVVSGREPTWTLADIAQDSEVSVTVIDSGGLTAATRTWTLTVLAQVNSHPDGGYPDLARDRLLVPQEERDWIAAESRASVEGWRSYLDRWPQAQRAGQAHDQLEAVAAREFAKEVENLGSADETLRENAKSKLRSAGTLALAPLTMGLDSSPNSAVRWRAAILLGELDSEDGIGPLTKALSDTDADVRVQAIRALGVLRGKPAVPALVQTLNDPVPLVRDQTLRALGAIGDAAAARGLLYAVDHAERFNTRTLAMVLGRAGSLVEDALIARLSTTDQPDRELVAQALAELGTAAAAEALISAVRQDEPAAINALAKIREDVLLDAAVSCVEREGTAAIEPLMMNATSQILVAIAPVAVLPLVAALGDSDEGVRARAVAALRRMGDPGVPFLIDALASKSFTQRRAAAKTLSVSQRPDVWQAVRSAGQHHDLAVLAGAYALIISKDDSTLDNVLVSALQQHGDRPMAVTFLNSGNAKLRAAAERWADANGYRVVRESWPGRAALPLN